MIVAITKAELSDRNKKLQKEKGYPNIPKGAEVYIGGYIAKYTPVFWKNRYYTVRACDLEVNGKTLVQGYVWDNYK